ncbi:MAG: hypothetical protein J6040_08260 [Clostridiales bacterium]|nr:hypothetical protein [Clostridiales bacterium]
MKLLQSDKFHQKNSKRGGMLIVVLMIFGVSLILISSALSITMSSRSRYYVDVERSQERLTLTCAAETVIDAIQAQEITDAQLQQMAQNTHAEYKITGASRTSVKAGATASDGSANIAPGLSTNANNATILKVSAVSGTQDIILDFSTKIIVTGDNTKSENLKVYMKYTPPAPTPSVCENMVTCGEEGSYNDIPKLEVNGTESFTVFHGDVELASGSGSYIHNPTVITGNVKGGAGTIYHNDVIFYGPNAGIYIPSPGNGVTIASGEGDFYFLGVALGENSGQMNLFKNSSGAPISGSGMNLKADGAYFYNTKMTVGDWTLSGNGAGTTYWVAGSGSNLNRTNQWDGGNIIVKDGGNVTTVSTSTNVVYNSISDVSDSATQSAYNRMKNRANNYLTSSALKAAAERNIPTSAEQTAVYGAYRTGETIPNISGVQNLHGNKAYKLTGGTYSHGRVRINLAEGDATIYVAGNCTFKSFCFEVSNATSHKLTFVLDYGVSFKFDDQPDFWSTVTDPTTGTSYPYVQGIIACDNRNGYNFASPHGGDLRGRSGDEPAAIVIGLGKNVFSAGRAQVVDAYISLAGTGTDASTVVLKDKFHFYVRFEAVKVDTGNSDNLKMQNCPKIGEGNNDPTPLTSCYSAQSYEYYYT